jgi:signal transduction histidine kinase
MRLASIPFNEELRLHDLYSYDILGSGPEKVFDDLLEVAAHIYGCPVAAISFIDKERQWLKSTIGIADNVNETSREVSFCSHTILDNGVMVVEDAAADERFCENPFVTDGLCVRFYAGAPIISSGGYRIGAICVIDTEPRELSRQEAKMLEILSRQISQLLELRLKNKLLRKKAEEQLLTEKTMLLKSLQEHELEKKTIATELHENIAQSLAASKFYLEMAEVAGFATKDLITKSRENIGAVVNQVRELSQSISPSMLLPEVELKPLLAGLLSQFHNISGIGVNFMYEGDGSVPSAAALSIYRIVEAQLQNVKSHARAANVTVNINVFSAVYLSIKDNGIGFDSKAFRRGAGLTRIVSNVEAMNGKVEIASGVKGGCELTVMIPR